MSKDVATTKNNAVAAAGGFDYGNDAGTGFEGTTGKDLSIPFLGVLQSNSPQVEDNSPEGSQPGMLFNTVTGALLAGSKGQPFLPVHYEHAFVEWTPRDKGGGFVASYAPDSDVVKGELAKLEKGRVQGKIILPNGNELIETHYAYGLLLDEAGASSEGFAVVSFTSTKIKPFRDWKTAMYLLKGKPPLFANRAVIRTIKQKNEKGTFYNFDIQPLKGGNWKDSLINPVSEKTLLDEARDFREMVLSGIAKPAYETQNSTGDSGNGNPDDAPF